MSNWRRELAQQAMLKAIEIRRNTQRDLNTPICIYSLCEDMKVPVRFVDISMEGMYARTDYPNILLSALRPLPRRVFTCGHELGHHVFGHGSAIDELIDETNEGSAYNPNEFLVNSFAGFLLMPTLGLRRAFTKRGWQADTATPEQLFIIACSFGVGYETLVSHLCFGLQMLSRKRAETLLKSGPKAIRTQILGNSCSDPLIVADRHWEMPTLDAEVGSVLLLPEEAEVGCNILAPEEETASGRVFRVRRPGITRAVCPGTDWSIFVRASRYQFVGLSRYRHLEDEEND